MTATKANSTSDELVAETAFDTGCPEIKKVIRPLPRRSFTLSPDDYPQAIKDRIDEEIKQKLANLYDRYRREKGKPSGSETQSVREAVWKRYNETILQGRLQLQLWSQSERTLNLLRAKGLYPEQQECPPAQVMTNFYDRLDLSQFPELNPSSPLYIGPESVHRAASIHSSANDLEDQQASQELTHIAYFSQIYPNLVRDFGFPFYTAIRKTAYPSDQINPPTEQLKGINTLFFAALLGGDKRLGHDVVYYGPESTFYFNDPLIGRYAPTTDAKIRFYLNHVLQDRAWGCDTDEAQIILENFCAPKVLDAIIDQAKALLAAEKGFFEGPRAYPRFTMDTQSSKDLGATVKSFLKKQIGTDETSILTITECMTGVKEYLKKSNANLPHNKEIKTIVETNIRELYGMGLRNDLVLPDNTCVVGWKGIRLDRLPLTSASQAENESVRNDSGNSDQSEPVPNLEKATGQPTEVVLLN